jgi:ATP-dependent exoDNAse (exonuclease V) alpha subunit
MTVHKFQGLELDTVKINIGTKEMSPGLTFVTISRVRRSQDVFFSTKFPLPQTILYWTNERDQTKSG